MALPAAAVRAAAPLPLLAALACAPAPAPPDDAPPAGPAPDDTAEDRSALPPIGVLRLTELRRSDAACEPEATATLWGPYDRAAEHARYGEEWEYWGWSDPPPGDDVCVGVPWSGGACEPACADDERCTVEGVCTPWPTPLDLGAIELVGATRTLRWERGVGGAYAGMTEVPVELFADADLVLRAEGGADGAPPPVTVTPPDALDLGLRCRRLLGTEDDLLLAWTPGPDPDARVRVWAREVQHGGGGGAPIVCEGPDDGELRIPAEVLHRGGASWLWEVEISRRQVGAEAFGAGELRLEAVAALRCSEPGPTCQ